MVAERAVEPAPQGDPLQRRLIMLARAASFLFQQAQQQARRSREPKMAALSLALTALVKFNIGPAMLEPMVAQTPPAKLRRWMRSSTRMLTAAQDSALSDEQFMAMVAAFAQEVSGDVDEGATDGRSPEA